MRALSSLLLLISWAMGASGCGNAVSLRLLEDLGYREQAIVNGTADSGHPSVGKIVDSAGKTCTGTLVGNTTVLTAGHCIGADLTYIFLLEGAAYEVSSALSYPQFISNGLENDIAVMILQEAPDVMPTPILTESPSPGWEIILVGFGSTSETIKDAGTKRLAKNTIKTIYPTRFNFEGGKDNKVGSTCYGDSGAPAFTTVKGEEVQIGVSSGGKKPCGTLAYDTRLDAYLNWLEKVTSGDLLKVGKSKPPQGAVPQVAIAVPVNGSIIRTDLTVSADITDEVEVVKGDLLVDGKITSTLEVAPYEFPITLTPGSHTIKVVGSDAAGNSGNQEITVTVSNVSQTGNPSDPNQTPEPGTFGASCQSPADCINKMCAEDEFSHDKFCTEACDPKSPTCPLSTECTDVSKKSLFVCSTPLRSLPGNQLGGQDAPQLLGGCSWVNNQRGGLNGTVMVMLVLWLFGYRRCFKRP